MPLSTLSFYHIVYEAAPPLLRGLSRRTMSAEEVTEGAELMLRAAQRHRCAYWLLDGRRHERPQPPTLHHWMQEEYFPRVRAELGQQLCVAFLESPTARQQAAPIVPPLPEWNTPAMRMGWFDDEATALAWLTRCRASLPVSKGQLPARSPEGSLP